LLNVFNIQKPLSFEGSFHFRKEKKSLVRDQENKMVGLFPQHNVRPEMSHRYQCGMERSIVVQQEEIAFCSKLWLHWGNAFQQSSDNLNIESTVDSLPFRHKFFMDHTLFVKK
jgi:hypothetical protein